MLALLTKSLGVPLRPLDTETVLFSHPLLWLVSGKSLPSYRVSLTLPWLQEIGLYVTDQRVVLPYQISGLLKSDWTAWFDSEDEVSDRDQIEAVSTGRHPLLGPYLQLLTYNPAPHWWRSQQGRIRCYMKDPEPVCRVIAETMQAAARCPQNHYQ